MLRAFSLPINVCTYCVVLDVVCYMALAKGQKHPLYQRRRHPPRCAAANDPERARAEIDRLRGNNRAMRQQLPNTLDEMRYGQRAVRATPSLPRGLGS